MARNDANSSRSTPSRVTKSRRTTQRPSEAPARAVKTRADRRRFWVQIMAAFLVLAMLLPVVAFFFT